MAVGPFIWPEMHPIAGVRLGTAAAGIKKNRDDITLIEITEGASVAALFTKNRFCAEPVKICREHLRLTTPRALLINAGNANACTGKPGRDAALSTCYELGALLHIATKAVLPFSTGVIGEVLPAQKISAALPAAIAALAESNWDKAAKAIMTTDTRPKGRSRRIFVGGAEVNITGIAKGAGMIKPNMGTMLSYVACDAKIAQALLDDIARRAVNKSFNRITIDGDTSTNDSFILIASGKARLPEIQNEKSAGFNEVSTAIEEVCQELALEMVRDAEGATKCVQVDVKGGKNPDECLKVAYAICHSPLVKTALFASDPNWGRIVAAIGYAGIDDLDPATVNVWLDDVALVTKGGRANSYREELGQKVFSKAEFSIVVDLGRGVASETLWSSDLSHEYVKINAEYRS